MKGERKTIWRCCPFLMITILFFVSAILLVSFAYIDKEAMRELVLEDGVIENIQAILFLMGSIVWILSFIAARKTGKTDRRKQIFYILFFLMFLFFFLEEISYGQRIFDTTTPEDLEEVNMQDETNIHNIGIGDSLLWIFILMALFLTIIGFVLPILKLASNRVLAFVNDMQFPVCNHNLTACFAMALVIYYAPGFRWYVPVFILAVILPVAIILSGRFKTFFGHFENPLPQFILVAVLGLVIIGLNANSETADNHSHNVAFEVRELLVAMALFFFALFEMQTTRQITNTTNPIN